MLYLCSKTSTKSGTNRTNVFDSSNESLYHADEELYTRFRIHSPCQTNSDLRHVGKVITKRVRGEEY